MLQRVNVSDSIADSAFGCRKGGMYIKSESEERGGRETGKYGNIGRAREREGRRLQRGKRIRDRERINA